MKVGVLMERRLDADNLEDYTIQIEKLSAVELQVNIRDNTGTVMFARNTMDGEKALDIYYHPWFHGFKEGGKQHAYNRGSEELAVS